MSETKGTWTIIPKPYPRAFCIKAYNDAAGTEYPLTKKSDRDEATESIIREVRAVLAARTAKEAVAFLEFWDVCNDPISDTWASEWSNPTTPFKMAKAVRAAFRALAGLEAV